MGGIDSYMNPYIDQAVNRAGADIDRQRQVSLNGNSAAATLAGGAFDGARHGVVDAETNRAYGDIFATTAANMRNTGFNNATSAMMTDRDRALQAGGANQTADLSLANQNAGMANATNLFNAGNKTQVSQGNAQNALTGQVANQNANTQAGGLRLGASDLLGGLSVDQLKSYLTGTQAIGNVGAQQDQNAQANINAQYEQYLRQQQYPYMNQQMLNSALGMFGGMSGTQQFQPRQTPVLNAMSSGKLFEKIKLF
jgi:hypothetical protein